MILGLGARLALEAVGGFFGRELLRADELTNGVEKIGLENGNFERLSFENTGEAGRAGKFNNHI